MAKWPFYHLKFYPTANTLIANDKDYSILHFPIEEIQMFYIENRDIEIKRRRKKKKKKKEISNSRFERTISLSYQFLTIYSTYFLISCCCSFSRYSQIYFSTNLSPCSPLKRRARGCRCSHARSQIVRRFPRKRR